MDVLCRVGLWLRHLERARVFVPVVAKGEFSMRRVLVGCGSATVFAAALALGSSASLAQSEELGARWGEGPDRLCNVVMDSDGEPVVQTTGEDPVTQNETFDCPEQVAAVHADTAGPPDYNMELSERRAETIATELARAGIPAQIITTEAYGETQLAVPTPDGTPEQANRRVVVDFQ